MPFPSTHVIHPRWSGHHQPISEGAMNATITVTHGTTGGGWSPTDGPLPEVPIVRYTGRARLTYETTQGRDADAVGQEVTTRTVTVAIPRDVDVQQHLARVTVSAVDANGPAWLVGRVLTVQSLGRSSHAWEQILECLDDLTNQPGATP